MTALSFSTEQASELPTSVLHSDNSAACQTGADSAVGQLTDDEREERITAHREAMEGAMRAYEETGCFDARGAADAHRMAFEREIAARSPAQIERMEQAQAARMGLEPGAHGA
jgi:hypothetical protein